MEEKKNEIIERTVSELLEKMGFSCQIEIKEDRQKEIISENKNEKNSGENLICNVTIKEDSNFLIGQYGINLQALQHLARLIIRKKAEEKINFVLDVNFYRQQKNQLIIEQAEAAVKQVINEKRAIVMKPMSAYERRIVHLVSSKNNQVITESIGEGEDRKVIIKPADNII
jgi:spoIIIJ-associated protein